MATNTGKKLTILFVTLDGYGHLNSCMGVAEKLVQHGHRVVFALEHAWRGKASRFAGMEEVTYVDPNRDPNLKANEHWHRFMEQFKETFGMDPIEAMDKSDPTLMEKFLNTMLDVDDLIAKILEEVKPDVVVVDSYTTIPSVYKSGIPWVWLTSANPLSCLPHSDLPPRSTDFPCNDDPENRKKWDEFNMKMIEKSGDFFIRFNKRMMDEFGIEPAPDGLCHPSPYLNIYAYPEDLDYLDVRPLPEKWQRFDHFIRFTEPTDSFKIPKEFLQKPLGKLIYVSMGSMGSADTDLMKRLISILSKSPNRFIFSLGPHADKLMPLPENIWGESFVPQMQIIPMVDLVITHGGNNTLLESLYYAKPVIVTPLFGDQLNNAQRVVEKGVGAKINPYKCKPEELLETIEKLLNDKSVKERIESISKKMQSSNSTENVAIAIEKVAMENQKN